MKKITNKVQGKFYAVATTMMLPMFASASVDNSNAAGLTSTNVDDGLSSLLGKGSVGGYLITGGLGAFGIYKMYDSVKDGFENINYGSLFLGIGTTLLAVKWRTVMMYFGLNGVNNTAG